MIPRTKYADQGWPFDRRKYDRRQLHQRDRREGNDLLFLFHEQLLETI